MHHVQLKALGSQPSPHHVRGSISDGHGGYLLEIANNCEACPKLLPLAAMAPEIEEFLELLESPLALLLLNKWKDSEYTLRNRQKATTYGFNEVSG